MAAEGTFANTPLAGVLAREQWQQLGLTPRFVPAVYKVANGGLHQVSTGVLSPKAAQDLKTQSS